jgi:hypothetical protein
MAYGAPTSERPVPHKEFQISVVPTDAGFEAWIERADGGLVNCGYSLSQAAGTHEYATAEEARSAARALIDAGEVRVRP